MALGIMYSQRKETYETVVEFVRSDKKKDSIQDNDEKNHPGLAFKHTAKPSVQINNVNDEYSLGETLYTTGYIAHIPSKTDLCRQTNDICTKPLPEPHTKVVYGKSNVNTTCDASLFNTIH